MWSLADFRFDHEIPGTEVYLLDEELGPECVLIAKDEAIALAHRRGENLVPAWPGTDVDAPLLCSISKVTLPLRWEQTMDSNDTRPELDQNLWFVAACGERDLLIGNGHTFTGRIAAWCPSRQVSYNISLTELGEMSEQARYWLRGFLAGAEPGLPRNGDDEPLDEDLAAWREATARFRRTGAWFGRWRTCRMCGCLLLPDTAAMECAQHRT